MKIKKRLIPLILTFSISWLIFAGCDNTVYHWKIDKSLVEIKSIEIVEIKGSMTLEVISEIDRARYQEIIDEIESLDATKYGWNYCPSFGKSVKITFEGGVFDVISLWEPHHAYINENGTINSKISWLKYNADDFTEFIEKWATK